MSTRLSTYNKKIGNTGKVWVPLPNTNKIFELFYGVSQPLTTETETKKEQDNA